MIISGFLFCLGVVLCIWCLANLDLIIGLIVLCFYAFVCLALAGIVLVAAWYLWTQEPVFVQAAGGVMIFWFLCYVLAEWSDARKAKKQVRRVDVEG